MKILSLELQNFKGLKHSKIFLDGKSSILFGVNGVGKSTVLNAVNILFAQIINKVTQNKFKQNISLQVDDIKFGESIAIVKASISLGCKAEDINPTYTYSRTIERRTRFKTHKSSVLHEIEEYFMAKYIENKEETNMPIYVNYGVNRAVYVVPIQRIRNRHTFNKLSAFEKAIENKIDFRMFFEWFREQQEFENNLKVNENRNYVDKQLRCVKRAILTMLSEDVFSDIKIMFNPVRMVATKENENLKIEQLSDGEKCTLAMIGDLARRLALANPSLANPLEGEGIVLIDEVELHLHPTWQARIVPTLRDTFPNIQFIITTHSPKVLGEVGDDINIFELERTENGIEITEIPMLIGWDSNYILETHMGTSSLNLYVKGKISHMFSLIKKKKFEEAEVYVNELEKLTDSSNPNVISARMLIARGRAGK
jgi:predicted ATP-binding protein involved in virulence